MNVSVKLAYTEGNEWIFTENGASVSTAKTS